MRPRRPTRLAGFSYLGCHRYSLRFCTSNRRRFFTNAEAVAAALLQIQRTCNDRVFLLLAYCFMPDHVHLAVEGVEDTSDLRRLVKVAKQRVAYTFRTEFAVPEVWQEGCYERVVRSDEATEKLIRYILENPVRAALVARAEDYPFAGAMYWPSHF